MDINKLNINKLINKLYEYKKLDFEVMNKEIYARIKNTNQDVLLQTILDKSILKDVEKDLIDFTILKAITDKHITNNYFILDLIVNGSNTYSLNWRNNYSSLYITKKSNFSINFSSRSDCLEENEKYQLSNQEFDELINCARNIFENLKMNSYPINFFRDEFGPQNILEKIMYKDNPEKFKEFYNETQINAMSIEFYNSALNDTSKNFWKSILQKEEMLKNLKNPLLVEKDTNFPLFQYKLNCECYKGDGYETYKTNIEKYYISHEPLDESKLKKLFEYNEYELKDILSFYIERLNNFETYHRTKSNCIFVEVRDNDYITRDNTHRFLYVDNLFFDYTKEAKKYNKNPYSFDIEDDDDIIEEENDLSNIFENYTKTIKITDDPLIKKIANEMNVSINNTKNQLNLSTIKDLFLSIKEAFESGENFDDVSKDLFNILKKSNEIIEKDIEYKNLEFQNDMER